MRLSQAWIIASKDLQTFTKKRYILYSTLGVPLLVSLLLPGVLEFVLHRHGVGAGFAVRLHTLLPAFAFFYLILSGVIPATIASYTIVGEKVEKSLEPLLATPTTDGEILLGKGVAAFLPPLGAILLCSIIFMALIDAATRGTLGHAFFPNGNALIVLFVMVPLAIAMSVEWNVIISARVTDVRVAQQIGVLLMIPFAGLYVGGELGVVDLGVAKNLWLIAAIQVVINILFLYLATLTFEREEILTKWR